jgi:hypothetical protein
MFSMLDEVTVTTSFTPPTSSETVIWVGLSTAACIASTDVF